MTKALTVAAAAFLFAAAAHADPFPKADPQAGKRYFNEAKCDACHASMMGGDGSRIFTRPDHRIKNAQALLKMVQACVNRTGASVFPEDIEDIAAYLNQRFYKFKE